MKTSEQINFGLLLFRRHRSLKSFFASFLFAFQVWIILSQLFAEKIAQYRIHYTSEHLKTITSAVVRLFDFNLFEESMRSTLMMRIHLYLYITYIESHTHFVTVKKLQSISTNIECSTLVQIHKPSNSIRSIQSSVVLEPG